MIEQSLTPEYRAQLEAASLMPLHVGGSDVVLTFVEPAAPSYRAYISNPDHSQVPDDFETDEMRIGVFAEGLDEPVVYLALRGREGLMAWHKENVGISLDRPTPIAIEKLVCLVTSNAILQALQADVLRESEEEAAAPRAS